MRYNIVRTLKGSETVDVGWGKGLSAIEAAAHIAQIMAEVETELDPDENPHLPRHMWPQTVGIKIELCPGGPLNKGCRHGETWCRPANTCDGCSRDLINDNAKEQLA